MESRSDGDETKGSATSFVQAWDYREAREASRSVHPAGPKDPTVTKSCLLSRVALVHSVVLPRSEGWRGDAWAWYKPLTHRDSINLDTDSPVWPTGHWLPGHCFSVVAAFFDRTISSGPSWGLLLYAFL